MPRKNLFQRSNNCDLCGFSTKNVYIFKRHRIRCRREHGLLTGRPRKTSQDGWEHVDSAPVEEPSVSMSVEMIEPNAADQEEHMSDVEMTSRTPILPEPEASTSAVPSSKPPPPVCRNYQCDQCVFTTTKSRTFLFHLVQVHSSKCDIFPCKFCEYCSRYKHKIQRHMKLAHKVDISYDEIEAEHTGSIKHRSPPTSKIKKKPVITKSIPGKNLTMKFVKQSGSSSPGKSSLLLSSGSISKVVREVLDQDGSVMFKCKECQFTSNDKQKVAKHAMSWHIDTKSFRCTHCNYMSFERNDFLAHRLTHRNQHQYKCKECTYSTDFRPNFERHMSNHTGTFPYKCKICSYGCAHEGSIKRHMTNSHGTPSSPKLKIKLPISQRSKDSIENVETVAEDITEPEREPLPRPKRAPRKSGRMVCPICRLRYNRSSDLNRHMKRKHNIKLKQYLDSIKDASMSDIELKTDGATDNFDGDQGQSNENDDDFVDEDNKSNDQPLDLSVGTAKQVPMSKLRCKHCSYQAKWPSDLRRHIGVHSVEKRFKCAYCPKKYKYMGDLNVHLRRDHKREASSSKVVKVPTATKTKMTTALFNCPHCPYTSCWKSEVDRHSRLHGDEKPYQCLNCEYQSFWKGDIRKHLYKEHPSVMTKDVAFNDVVAVRQDLLPVVSGGIKMDTESVDIADIESEEEGSSDDIEKALSTVSSDKSDVEDIEEMAGMVEIEDTTYKCKLCPFVANAPSKMSAHVATHKNLKKYKCPICGRRANWKWDIAKHIKKDHPNNDVSVVRLSTMEAESTIQSYIESNPVVRREHHLNINISSEKNPASPIEPDFYKCSICDFSAEKRLSISRHIRYMHEKELAEVIVVRRNSDTPKPDTTMKDSAPATPQETKTVEKPFMCAECGKRGATKGDIKKHYHYIHPDKDIRIMYLGDEPQNTPTIQPEMELARPSPCSTLVEKLPPGKVLSQPKTLGYIRPFKCSICGRRSNWKWDCSKHQREKHPGQSAYVITLSEEEARSTVEEYMQKTLPELNRASLSPNRKPRSSSTSALSQSTENGDDPATPAEIYIPSKGIYRQFKCSSCAYRTNWRTDLQRHIDRRHGPGRARVIVLDPKVAQETLDSYKYNRFLKSPDRGDGIIAKAVAPAAGGLQKTGLSEDDGGKKMWKCCVCPYVSEVKVEALNHLSKHNMKTYRCTACHHTSNFRATIHRHIRARHGDNLALCKLSIKLIRGGTGASESTAYEEDQSYSPVTFHCKLCPFQSSWRSCVCRHIRIKHKSKEYTKLVVKKLLPNDVPIVVKISDVQQNPVVAPIKSPSLPPPPTPQQPRQESAKLKKYMCSICPYRSQKLKMLKFHMSCHKRQPGVKQVKCKFCPYYVTANRLLAQHVQLHLQDYKPGAVGPVEVFHPPATPVKVTPSKSPDVTPKRHQCEKCPYTTNSKNDFLYHKQFHRPKPTADFKCDQCEYWVTHKRLLKQHMKVHESATSRNVSTSSSPTKSEYSENSLVYDTVEIAAIKQRIIAAKITPSISQTPLVSPMKLASNCSIGNKRGYIMKNGVYRRIHRCRFCPYMNVRARNLRLHEMMHGRRQSSHPLMKCPHCNYFVGSKGLLAHHLKVHQPNYGLEVQGATAEAEKVDDGASEESDRSEYNIPYENKVDTLLEIARFKKYGCEKCPYSSAKRSHFERHVELHGSKQKCVCIFCDYSVPSQNLLNQHKRLHLEPNQNLLAAQSIGNLQHLPEMPADIALSGMITNTDINQPVSVTHDHMDLYENTPEDCQPKKVYRCDRCPYANVRRDHLLAHLRCHMIKNEYACPYCDYSVAKTHVLVQHVKVHFSPLPELSDWLAQNGQIERVKETKDAVLKEAIQVAQMYQNDEQKGQTVSRQSSVSSGKSPITVDASSGPQDDGQKEVSVSGSEPKPSTSSAAETTDISHDAIDEEVSFKVKPNKGQGTAEMGSVGVQSEEGPTKDFKEQGTPEEEAVSMEVGGDSTVAEESKDDEQTEQTTVKPDIYVCQYCDREFTTSDHLVWHEMQHLIGNNFEGVIGKLGEASVTKDVPAVESVQKTEENQENEKPGTIEQIDQLNVNGETELLTKNQQSDSLNQPIGSQSQPAGNQSQQMVVPEVAASETNVVAMETETTV